MVSSNGVTGVRIQRQEREREKEKEYGKKNEKKKYALAGSPFWEKSTKKSNVYYKMSTRALNVDYILIFKQKSGSHSSNKPVFNESE